jgi:hypothetical protein
MNIEDYFDYSGHSRDVVDSNHGRLSVTLTPYRHLVALSP